MKETKQVSVRIDTEFIEKYLDGRMKYREKYFPNLPPEDLTMTRLLHEALFYGNEYFKEAIKE